MGFCENMPIRGPLKVLLQLLVIPHFDRSVVCVVRACCTDGEGHLENHRLDITRWEGCTMELVSGLFQPIQRC